MLDAIYRDTGELPPALAKKPDLDPECRKYYETYRLLDRSRDYNEVGPIAIPVSEILSLIVQGFGLKDSETKLKYIRLVQLQDAIECNYYREKNQRKMKARGKK